MLSLLGHNLRTYAIGKLWWPISDIGESDFILQPSRMHNFIISNQSECIIPAATTTVPNIGEWENLTFRESDFQTLANVRTSSSNLMFSKFDIVRELSFFTSSGVVESVGGGTDGNNSVRRGIIRKFFQYKGGTAKN